MRKVGLLIVAGLILGVPAAQLSTAALARGKAAKCSGKLDPGRYRKLIVPAGTTCDGTDARIHVRRGVWVREGATFILGSEDSGGGTGTIRGGIHADSPGSLQVHFAHVRGGVRMQGGNGYFSAVEDNNIRGDAKIKGYSGTWLGFIRNQVHGSVTLSNNLMDDPDANEYVTNTISGSLVCHRNSPAPQKGDSGGGRNIVAGKKVGQCAGL